MRTMLLLLGYSTSIAFAVAPAVAAPPVAADAPDTVRPVDRTAAWWQARQKFINEQIAGGDIELVFIGDSITQGWNDNEVWQEFYGKRKAANLGIGGDRTQHVLWRLDHGNLEGVDPKLAVVMIGTNNSGANTAEEIAQGIEAIVAKLRDMRPEMKVLLLAIFPRSERPDTLRAKNAQASELASQVADGEMVHFLDIGPQFLSEGEALSKEIMPDYLHLSVAGYRIWAEAIEEKVAELLGEK